MSDGKPIDQEIQKRRAAILKLAEAELRKRGTSEAEIRRLTTAEAARARIPDPGEPGAGKAEGTFGRLWRKLTGG